MGEKVRGWEKESVRKWVDKRESKRKWAKRGESKRERESKVEEKVRWWEREWES